MRRRALHAVQDDLHKPKFLPSDAHAAGHLADKMFSASNSLASLLAFMFGKGGLLWLCQQQQQRRQQRQQQQQHVPVVVVQQHRPTRASHCEPSRAAARQQVKQSSDTRTARALER